MTLSAQQVFTPGAFPTHTYVQRTDQAQALEQKLKDAVSTPGQIVSLIGPSKSGKTVLVEKVVGPELLITITGAGIRSADDIWDRVLDWMQAPHSTETTSSTSGTVKLEGKAGGSLGVPFVAKGKAELGAGAELSHDSGSTAKRERRGLTQVVKDIADSDYVLLIDDFHYMPRDVQAEAAKSLKEAVRLGVKVCTASVVHRGDDLVRANPELRGRVFALDLKYWDLVDLSRIAEVGFGALNFGIKDHVIQRLAIEAAGSPQLMQLLCLHTCFVANARARSVLKHEIVLDGGQVQAVLEQASSATDFRSLVDVLDGGPKTRGTERKLYSFTDGSEGDVYRAVLKAVASDPPILTFNYQTLLDRVASICPKGAPVGSSIVSTCLHLPKLAEEKFPTERAIDWDDQKQILDIPDPYLLFYLRWSRRLTEPG